MGRDLLFEIGSEEIPAAELDAVLAALPTLLGQRLEDARLTHEGIRVWGTPRRVAARVTALPERQPDLEEPVSGHPERVAYKDGQPTKAAEKFAEKAGVDLDQLELVDTPKGRYLTGQRVVAGEPSVSVLPGICRQVIEGFGFRKSMRWAAREQRFVRPVRWLVALFGDDVLDLEFAGVSAGRETWGHRFHAPGPVTIPSPADYESVLAGVHVVPDRADRRALIANQIAALEKDAGATILPDEALLDEVTNLVEWPVAVCGEFDADFLEVPREVIISAMRGHQRYFAMEQDGRLAPRFITVLGTEVRDLAVAVRGNQRVLAARLSDARFFWDEDLKKGLDAWSGELGTVVFQAKLGTVAEKVARLEPLTREVAARFGADAEAAAQAARLCKADLVTHMVGEFPDLQGVMGRHYARAQKSPEPVANAVLEHYQPRGAGGALPASPEGAALALADRLDTLVGCIGAGLKPKGGGDPFGLRRATLGVLRILLEREIGGSLGALVDQSIALYTVVEPDRDDVVRFMLDRLRGLLAEDAPGEIVQAVMSAGGDDPVDLAQRVKAVQAFSQTDEYAALATTFRRMNILKQADVELGSVDEAALTEAAEKALWTAFDEAREAVEGLLDARQYEKALEKMAGLRPPVDEFFVQVKVMADDATQRANRLALLSAVDRLFRRVADFKLIAG